MAGPDHPRGRAADAADSDPDAGDAPEAGLVRVDADDDRFWVPDDPLDIRLSYLASARQGGRELPPLPDSPAAQRSAAADLSGGSNELDTPDARRSALIRFAAEHRLPDCPGETRPDDDALSPETVQWVKTYIEQQKVDRPWLAPAEGHDSLVQYVYVARDLAGGHDLRRHEGHRGDQGQADRAMYHMDPAHAADSPAYLNSTDAFHGGDTLPDSNRGRKREQHFCGDYATQIANAEAYAVAIARIHENPEVKRALAMPATEPRPEAVGGIKIADILGADGHRACNGYERVTDEFASEDEAKTNHRKWVEEVRTELSEGAADSAGAWDSVRLKAGALGLVEPKIRSIHTFASGEFEVDFKPKADGTGYEIVTLFVNPSTASAVDSARKDTRD